MLLFIFQSFCLFFLIAGFHFRHQCVVSCRPLPALKMAAGGCNLKLVAAATCWSRGEPPPRPANGYSLFANRPTYFVLSRGLSLLSIPQKKEFTKFPVPFTSLLSKCVPQTFRVPFCWRQYDSAPYCGPQTICSMAARISCFCWILSFQAHCLYTKAVFAPWLCS